MITRRYVRACAIGAFVGLVFMAGQAPAADTSTTRAAPPAVRIDKGAQCVEPVAEMRRNHMNMLMHQRDATVHRGIRTTKHSLKYCIDCHANAATNSVTGKDGFCESCHAYTAVRVDCFECHSPSPRKTAAANAGDARGTVIAVEPARHAVIAVEPARRAVIAVEPARRLEGKAP